ncbi:ankyrin repeat protein [Tanapox virus]|uniref:Ankyrin repeat protein n=1 Tax=Tanapox virus TaxID=99000 RepID=A7XCA9_9POXV|nr:ankyrin repeat protein [Tanapox virus]ABQ43635.1 ankyrin repeat protein [Tanapox virus]
MDEERFTDYDEFIDDLFVSYTNPIFYYVWKNDIENVKKWSCFVNTFNEYYETPIHTCLENKNASLEMVEFLIKSGADVNHKTKHYGFSPLHSYLSINENVNIDILQLMVKNGSDIESLDEDGKTPFHRYMTNCNVKIDVVKYLYKLGCSIYNIDNDGNNMLHSYFLLRSEDEISNFLIEEGVDINSVNKYGVTPYQLKNYNKVFLNKTKKEIC